MTKFERTQVWFTAVQTAIFLCTLSAAIYLGVGQNRINQQLLEMNFIPSVEVVLENHQLMFRNSGKDNVWLCGQRFGAFPPLLEPEPTIMVVGATSASMDSAAFEQFVMTHVPPDTEKESRTPYTLYIRAADGKYYDINNTILVRSKESAKDVRLLQHSITLRRTWPPTK